MSLRLHMDTTQAQRPVDRNEQGFGWLVSERREP